MKLKGLIEEVFRGVTIFRGYATLGTLAKLSTPQDYQLRKIPGSDRGQTKTKQLKGQD